MRIRNLCGWAAACCLGVASVCAADGVPFTSDDASSQFAVMDGMEDSTYLAGYDNGVGDGGSKAGCDANGNGWLGAIQVDGWIDTGVLLNSDEPPSGFHGTYNQTDRHEAALNQAYLAIEKPLGVGRVPGAGFRIDMLYGTDFFLAQSKGVEWEPDGSGKWNGDHYGLAIPQAYGQIGNERLSLKLGHFYTIVGYEGVPAVNNFFYTKSLSYMFAGPFVEWGGLATYKPGDRLTVDFGLVNGWNAFDRVEDRAAFLGRVQLGSEENRAWTSFSVISGDELNLAGTHSDNRTRYSAILGVNLTSRLQYVFHHWYGWQTDYLGQDVSADWYGIDQYLYYRLTSKLRAGARFEWFRDDDGVRLGLSRPSNPNKNPFVGNYCSTSLGLNWTPSDYLTVRPEMRWDWFEGTGLPFGDGTADDQLLFGVDAIVRF